MIFQEKCKENAMLKSVVKIWSNSIKFFFTSVCNRREITRKINIFSTTEIHQFRAKGKDMLWYTSCIYITMHQSKYFNQNISYNF